jgi:hypothetical protein
MAPRDLAPPCFREGWVPTFELIDWPGLDELRAEHHRMIAELHEATGALSSIRRKYAKEDSAALAAEKRAITRGGSLDPDHQIVLTPALRRRANIEVAEQRLTAARNALCAHVKLIVRESLQFRPDAEDAFKEAAKRPAALEDDPNAWRSKSIEEIEAMGAQATAVRVDGHDPELQRRIERDKMTLQSWFLTTLGGDGENVHAELNEVS